MALLQTLARNMAMSVERKINIRKQMRTQLKAMDVEDKRALDHQVLEQLFSHPELLNADFVYGYMNLFWETGTEEILDRLWNAGVKVALPKVLGDTMEFFHVRSREDLAVGFFKILEPKESCEQVFWPKAPVLVPGLAFSKDGKRLGKGGGYYDKFLSKEPEHRTIALAYEFQLTDEIPAEEHDRPVDVIVTEKTVYRIQSAD